MGRMTRKLVTSRHHRTMQTTSGPILCYTRCMLNTSTGLCLPNRTRNNRHIYICLRTQASQPLHRLWLPMHTISGIPLTDFVILLPFPPVANYLYQRCPNALCLSSIPISRIRPKHLLNRLRIPHWIFTKSNLCKNAMGILISASRVFSSFHVALLTNPTDYWDRYSSRGDGNFTRALIPILLSRSEATMTITGTYYEIEPSDQMLWT